LSVLPPPPRVSKIQQLCTNAVLQHGTILA
jgi:hypothetical protein